MFRFERVYHGEFNRILKLSNKRIMCWVPGSVARSVPVLRGIKILGSNTTTQKHRIWKGWFYTSRPDELSSSVVKLHNISRVLFGLGSQQSRFALPPTLRSCVPTVYSGRDKWCQSLPSVSIVFAVFPIMSKLNLPFQGQCMFFDKTYWEPCKKCVWQSWIWALF